MTDPRADQLTARMLYNAKQGARDALVLANGDPFRAAQIFRNNVVKAAYDGGADLETTMLGFGILAVHLVQLEDLPHV